MFRFNFDDIACSLTVHRSEIYLFFNEKQIPEYFHFVLSRVTELSRGFTLD